MGHPVIFCGHPCEKFLGGNTEYEGSQLENKQYEKSSIACAALLFPLSHDHIPTSELFQLK